MPALKPTTANVWFYLGKVVINHSNYSNFNLVYELYLFFYLFQILYVFFSVLRSPSIMGIVVADRKFFGEIGSLDGGMKIYGGENVELGIRVRFLRMFQSDCN